MKYQTSGTGYIHGRERESNIKKTHTANVIMLELPKTLVRSNIDTVQHIYIYRSMHTSEKGCFKWVPQKGVSKKNINKNKSFER